MRIFIHIFPKTPYKKLDFPLYYIKLTRISIFASKMLYNLQLLCLPKRFYELYYLMTEVNLCFPGII